MKLPVAALLMSAAAAAAGAPVGLTPDRTYLDVQHDGKPFRIEREQDGYNQIDPDYALTSRPCPPYCIQPMQLAPGVDTVGELEVLAFLERIAGGDGGVLLIDSRDAEWAARSGMIPGATHLPWTRLHPAHVDAEAIAETLQMVFAAARSGPLWNFENARTLVFYCNGAWCGQSPTNIRQLLALGYPAQKLKWYRGGMQAWKSLGLPTTRLVKDAGAK
jgi:rhodanese-related sulfurtransferase